MFTLLQHCFFPSYSNCCLYHRNSIATVDSLLYANWPKRCRIVPYNQHLPSNNKFHASKVLEQKPILYLLMHQSPNTLFQLDRTTFFFSWSPLFFSSFLKGALITLRSFKKCGQHSCFIQKETSLNADSFSASIIIRISLGPNHLLH